MTKRVLTIQDISCIGKCSITIAVPIISALGSEAVILPTALLSAHSIFEGYTFKDLSDQIEPITSHWKKEGVRFDAIYTGYLGTIDQIDQVKKIFADFREAGTLIFVDPAMADSGRLYPGFDMAYARKNAELCGAADIIVPNITEAAIMTDMEYRRDEDQDEKYIREMLSRLAELGARINVITGVSLERGRTGVMGLDTVTGEYYIYQNDKVDAVFHGTGDLFSSTCVGEMMRGRSWRNAMKLASQYTAHTIAVTMQDPDKPWYGVDFEATIPDLVRAQDAAGDGNPFQTRELHEYGI